MKTRNLFLAVAAALLLTFSVVTLFNGFRVGLMATQAEATAYVSDNLVSLVVAFVLAFIAAVGGALWGAWSLLSRLGTKRRRQLVATGCVAFLLVSTTGAMSPSPFPDFRSWFPTIRA